MDWRDIVPEGSDVRRVNDAVERWAKDRTCPECNDPVGDTAITVEVGAYVLSFHLMCHEAFKARPGIDWSEAERDLL